MSDNLWSGIEDRFTILKIYLANSTYDDPARREQALQEIVSLPAEMPSPKKKVEAATSLLSLFKALDRTQKESVHPAGPTATASEREDILWLILDNVPKLRDKRESFHGAMQVYEQAYAIPPIRETAEIRAHDAAKGILDPKIRYDLARRLFLESSLAHREKIMETLSLAISDIPEAEDQAPLWRDLVELTDEARRNEPQEGCYEYPLTCLANLLPHQKDQTGRYKSAVVLAKRISEDHRLYGAIQKSLCENSPLKEIGDAGGSQVREEAKALLSLVPPASPERKKALEIFSAACALQTDPEERASFYLLLANEMSPEDPHLHEVGCRIYQAAQDIEKGERMPCRSLPFYSEAMKYVDLEFSETKDVVKSYVQAKKKRHSRSWGHQFEDDIDPSLSHQLLSGVASEAILRMKKPFFGRTLGQKVAIRRAETYQKKIEQEGTPEQKKILSKVRSLPRSIIG